MKAVVAAFNQEKALVGAFSVVTNLRMELFEALVDWLCQSQDTSTAPLPPRLPLLPGVGLHGNTTAEDHWPLHCRHQSCNKQTWPGHTPRHRHRDQCGIQTMSPHSAGHCKLNQYNLTMDGQLQNLNATLVYFYTDIFFLNRITLPSYTWYLSTKLKVFAN